METPESKGRIGNPASEESDARADGERGEANSDPMWGFWTALVLSSVFGLFLWFGVVSVLFGYELLSVFFVLLGCLFISTASRLVA
jgi:hypothetical protein